MITSSDVHTHHNRQCRLRLAQYHMEMLISNILRDKSFVDDLNKEQGIVSMRVGSALRSTEIKPLFPDLWRTHTPTFWLLSVVRQLKSPLPCGLYRVVIHRSMPLGSCATTITLCRPALAHMFCLLCDSWESHCLCRLLLSDLCALWDLWITLCRLCVCDHFFEL